MTLDAADVIAANDAWVWTPDGADVVETGEYRLARFPDHFADPLQLQRLRTSRPAAEVLAEIVERAAGYGLPELYVYAKLGAPDGFDDALLDRGARLADTADVLALALPADLPVPALPGLDVRWRTTPQVARDAGMISVATFGGRPAGDDALAVTLAADRAGIPAGRGGAVVAYLDDVPVAGAGIEIVGGAARMWSGAVLPPYRGKGIYRALVAARLAYAAEHGARLALTQGRVATSSPILRRIGYLSYGRERCYRLPLSSPARR